MLNAALFILDKMLAMKKILAFILIGLTACSPKVAEPVVEVEEVPVIEVDPNDPCRTWNDLLNKDEVIEAHVLYRDFLKQGDYDAAFPLWKKAFEQAPLADGNRMTHFEDGIALNYHFLKQTGDGTYKDEILNVLLPKMRACSDKPGYAAGRQAFDLYYNYKDLATEREIYELFKKAIDESGLETEAFILNPFIKVLSDLHLADSIPIEEAQNYVLKIRSAMDHGIANCGDDCEDWKVVQSYVPGQMDRLESVKGFYDCDYYLDKYFPDFDANRSDCEVVEDVYIRLLWADCDPADPRFAQVAEVKSTTCKYGAGADPDLAEGRDCLESGDYRCAMNAYQRYVDKTDDLEKKAKFTLRMAKIAYAHLKNYSKARSLALKAADYKSGWGEPYMLIGNLYASSGPLCGPGTGWDSQIVTWPAIDKWNYAKRVDPSVASKANQLIGKYSQFMPSLGDIFQRGLKEGQSFRVECWINETTTIRAARG